MTNTTKTGGYAYPRDIPDIVCSPEEAAQIVHEHSGMTLRDAAALAALQGLCANSNIDATPPVVAGAAWRVADAFIAAREGKSE